MLKAYKYRIYPNLKQQRKSHGLFMYPVEKCQQILGVCLPR